MTEFIEKQVTVLDLMCDIESVVARYRKKGWAPVSYVQVHEKGGPRSVKIKFKKPKG